MSHVSKHILSTDGETCSVSMEGVSMAVLNAVRASLYDQATAACLYYNVIKDYCISSIDVEQYKHIMEYVPVRGRGIVRLRHTNRGKRVQNIDSSYLIPVPPPNVSVELTPDMWYDILSLNMDQTFKILVIINDSGIVEVTSLESDPISTTLIESIKEATMTAYESIFSGFILHKIKGNIEVSVYYTEPSFDFDRSSLLFQMSPDEHLDSYMITSNGDGRENARWQAVTRASVHQNVGGMNTLSFEVASNMYDTKSVLLSAVNGLISVLHDMRDRIESTEH
ncbi:hypothetical protein HDU85_005907 [Gaertneriomyces sp. JEL0708]|nr:hypothetical protein HDU85_005907 [Gaertneriomyces sp. JEL0708]